MLTLVPSDRVPDGWIPLMHPEGALYWVHRTDVSAGSHTRGPA